MKDSGSRTAGKNDQRINAIKESIELALTELIVPKIISPRFAIEAGNARSSYELICISDGKCGYNDFVINDINFSMYSGDKTAIIGRNGSGKTTFIKAIINNDTVVKCGEWRVIDEENIGYLDQHYSNLDPDKTAYELLELLRVNWHRQEIREHLNAFLFSKNEEVYSKVKTFSGGERARLSLALISARVPKLLILDEITNNIDLATKAHMIQVLGNYPGAILIISHDHDFLSAININNYYEIKDGNIKIS